MATKLDLPKQLCVAPKLGLDFEGATLLVADQGAAALFDAHTGAQCGWFPWVTGDEEGIEMMVAGREQDLEELDPSEMFGMPLLVAFSPCGRFFAAANGHYSGSAGFNDAYLFDRESPGRPIRYLDINRSSPDPTAILAYYDPESLLFTSRELLVLGEFGVLAFSYPEPGTRRIELPPVVSKLELPFTAGSGASLALHGDLLAVGWCDTLFIVQLSDGTIVRELRSPGKLRLGSSSAFAGPNTVLLLDVAATSAWRVDLGTGRWQELPLGGRAVWLAADGSSAIIETPKGLVRVSLPSGKRKRILPCPAVGRRPHKLLHVSGNGRAFVRTAGGTTLGDDTGSVVITRLRPRPA